ncbi:hypothetical protein, partial [Micrococcus aloeverae]
PEGSPGFFSSVMVMILTVPLGTAYTDHLTRPDGTPVPASWRPFFMSTPTPVQARSALAHASRWGTPADVVAARRTLAAAKIAAYVSKVLDEAPPLTVEQRDHLTGLLRPSKAGETE